jgi:hypothetical protein
MGGATLEVAMSATVLEVLASFDALPDSDKQVVAAEILRRTPSGDLSTTTLDALADELFATLDDEETTRAQR